MTRKLLWMEDDAKPPDRERHEAAWLRLFGEPAPRPSTALTVRDLGDLVEYVFPNGRVLVFSCEGAAIYQEDAASPAEPEGQEGCQECGGSRRVKVAEDAPVWMDCPSCAASPAERTGGTRG